MFALALLAAALTYDAARAIAVAPRERPSWALLELPQSIDPGASQNYADLRIVDDRGRQIPYVLDPQCAAIPTRNALVSDAGFAPGRYTEAILDAGTSGMLYSGVSLTTSRDTFFEHVDVAISDDRSLWRDVVTGALIYRVGSSDPGTQTIVLSPARSRWIRIRVRDPRAVFPIDSASLDGTETAAPDAMKRIAAQTSVRTDADRRVTVITLDVLGRNTRVAWLRFDTSQPEFSRDVTVARSDDGENWDFAGGGRIERFTYGTPVLDVPVSEGSGRYIRATIDNGDDVPLAGLDVKAYGPRRTIAFVAAPYRSYALTRFRGASPPVYDINALLEHDNPRHFASARLAGAAVMHPTSAPAAAAFSQPLILSIAFGVAIALLGAVTLVSLKPRRSSRDR